MKISSKGRYAVRVMIALATKNSEYLSISELSDTQHISIKYLEKIASMLVKAKFIESKNGVTGGYTLTRPPKDYTMAEILELTGDAPTLAPCLKSDTPCDHVAECTTIGYWDTLQKLIYDYLNSVTLEDIINKTYRRC